VQGALLDFASGGLSDVGEDLLEDALNISNLS